MVIGIVRWRSCRSELSLFWVDAPQPEKGWFDRWSEQVNDQYNGRQYSEQYSDQWSDQYSAQHNAQFTEQYSDQYSDATKALITAEIVNATLW
jgi:hypothetical protein